MQQRSYLHQHLNITRQQDFTSHAHCVCHLMLCRPQIK
jgi:hypothetical protein